ncbi:MAG: hypothetical protein JJT78_03885 [Leptospira sp.]|nr:hypothetical protein [Leptospira sp.]
MFAINCFSRNEKKLTFIVMMLLFALPSIVQTWEAKDKEPYYYGIHEQENDKKSKTNESHSEKEGSHTDEKGDTKDKKTLYEKENYPPALWIGPDPFILDDVPNTAARRDTKAPSVDKVYKDMPWYERISLRGYTQIRYNRLGETNPELKCEQCDRSWGENGGFMLRRARMVFSGDVHPNVFVYIQPDFASTSGTGLHFAQIRDIYFDLSLDDEKEFRFRVGQSKVPYGFENLQSSANRLALDRNDPLNSAVANERDLGFFFYYAPKEVRRTFKYLIQSGLKGSGDYGMIGVGAYNGQTANNAEANDEPHAVARVTYPWRFANGQIFETGVQAYKGLYKLRNKTKGVGGEDEFLDERQAVSFTWYPQPFGFQAEYNVGRGPEYNKETNDVELRNLYGGYLQLMMAIRYKSQLFIPFLKGQYYNGGKKHEIDARSHRVRDYEIGLEWQPHYAFELVVSYTRSQRRFEDGALPENYQEGSLVRIQLQINY